MYFATALVTLALAATGYAAPAVVNSGDGESTIAAVNDTWPLRDILFIATFFAPGVGSCGISSSASDHIVAVSASFFDTFP